MKTVYRWCFFMLVASIFLMTATVSAQSKDSKEKKAYHQKARKQDDNAEARKAEAQARRAEAQARQAEAEAAKAQAEAEIQQANARRIEQLRQSRIREQRRQWRHGNDYRLRYAQAYPQTRTVVVTYIPPFEGEPVPKESLGPEAWYNGCYNGTYHKSDRTCVTACSGGICYRNAAP